jgi:DNA-binding transcriptional MocR family regulator
MHLTVSRPNSIRDVEISERAARENLWIWPLSPNYLGQVTHSGFILGFGSTDVAEIPRAVRRLSGLLARRPEAMAEIA